MTWRHHHPSDAAEAFDAAVTKYPKVRHSRSGLLGASGLRAIVMPETTSRAVGLHATACPALLGHVGDDQRGARDDVTFEDEPADER